MKWHLSGKLIGRPSDLLAGEGLRELFVYTRLKSSDVGPNVGKAAGHSLPPLLCFIPPDSPLAKLGVCVSEASGKQIPHKLNMVQVNRLTVLLSSAFTNLFKCCLVRAYYFPFSLRNHQEGSCF